MLKCHPLFPSSTILRWLRVRLAGLDSHAGPLRTDPEHPPPEPPPDGARPASLALPAIP